MSTKEFISITGLDIPQGDEREIYCNKIVKDIWNTVKNAQYVEIKEEQQRNYIAVL